MEVFHARVAEVVLNALAHFLDDSVYLADHHWVVSSSRRHRAVAYAAYTFQFYVILLCRNKLRTADLYLCVAQLVELRLVKVESTAWTRQEVRVRLLIQ